MIKTQPHTVWVDNFSKNIAWQLPKIEHGVYKPCLWTGFALKLFTQQPDLDMYLKRDALGNIIPAMPDNPLPYKQSLVALYRKNEKAVGMKQLETSYVQRWAVNNVPLKPLVVNVPAQYHAALAITESIHNLYPEKLVDLNPGDNGDTMKVFKGMLDEKLAAQAAGEPATYTMINLDMDIYDKALKVPKEVFRCCLAFPT